MFDLDEAFHALEELDGQGRKALVLCEQIWQEVHRDALARAAKAEFLLARLQMWTSAWGLQFDLSKAAARWETEHERPLAVLERRYRTRLSELGAEVRELGARLDEALEGREWAEMRAEEAEERLRAHGGGFPIHRTRSRRLRGSAKKTICDPRLPPRLKRAWFSVIATSISPWPIDEARRATSVSALTGTIAWTSVSSFFSRAVSFTASLTLAEGELDPLPSPAQQTCSEQLFLSLVA